MSHRIYLSIIAVMVCYILFSHYCNPPKCPPNEIIRDTIKIADNNVGPVYRPIPSDTVSSSSASIGRSSSPLIGRKIRKTTLTFGSDTLKTPLASFNPTLPCDSAGLVVQNLDNNYSPVWTVVYDDTVKLKHGYIAIHDTVEGMIKSRQIKRNLAYPVEINNTALPKPRSQWYLGPRVLGNSFSPISFVGGSLDIKTRKDVLYSIQYYNNLKGVSIYGGGVSYKLSFRK